MIEGPENAIADAINAAEEIPVLLDALVEKTAPDPGQPPPRRSWSGWWY